MYGCPICRCWHHFIILLETWHDLHFDIDGVPFSSKLLLVIWIYVVHFVHLCRKNMIHVTQKTIVPWNCCHSWRRGQRLLRLWQHKTLSLLFLNLVFVQHIAEVGTVMDIISYHVYSYREETVFEFSLLDAETNRRICFLNATADEVVRSLFFNKYNDSLIIVSVYASDNFSSLKCRSTRIE